MQTNLVDGEPPIFRLRKEWQGLPQEELAEYKRIIFDYYRRTGYPYHIYSKKQKLSMFYKLKHNGYDHIIQGDVINQTMSGLALAWAYHPHGVSIQNGDSMSVLEAFNDDRQLRKTIDYMIKFRERVTDNQLRKTLMILSGVKGISNFRPTAAAAIYDKFCPDNGVVWDMCSGFGGRLLGFLVAKKPAVYIGFEPSTQTYNGLRQMTEDLLPASETFTTKKKVFIHNTTSEDHFPINVDLCFTSPPYFNTEKYSTEPTQSYLRYPTIKEWRTGFLRKTIENCYVSLKYGGTCIINIANVKTYPDLEKHTVQIGKDVGFVYDGMLKYALSKYNDGFKFEPCFVFVKKE